MRACAILLLFILFAVSAYINCAVYGSVATVPYFGNRLVEKAEKERDVFLRIYIAGGSYIAADEKIRRVSLNLVRRIFTETLASLRPGTGSISRFDPWPLYNLAAVFLRLNYWLSPLSLGLLIITLLLRKPSQGI